MKRLRVYAPIIAFFCLALLVRLAYNVTVARGYFPAYDARYYDTIAKNLLGEHCFCLVGHTSTTDRAPLWSFIIAIIYAVTGPINFYARFFFCLIDAGTCVIVYLFARDIFNQRTGLIAGTLATLYAGLFIYTGWLYTETLYTFCLMAFAYTLYLLQRTGLLRWAVYSGLSLALASLTRPNGFFALGMVCVWGIIVIRARIIPWRTVVQAILIITLITAGLIAPWTIRNYRVAHIFIPVATGSGVVLAGVYNDTALTDPELLGMWVPGNRIRPPIPRSAHPSYMGENENRGYAFHWIETHLSSMPYLLSLHFINTWKPYTSEEGLPFREFPDRTSSKIAWNLIQYMPIVIIALATLGLATTWKKRIDLLAIYLILLLTIGVNIAFYGSMRFRAPIEPLLVILAAGVIWWLTSTDAGTLRALRQGRSNNTTQPDRANGSAVSAENNEKVIQP
jgi:4-amino-4-deoxy-L-arabinose transferase-like glycosyltransferase